MAKNAKRAAARRRGHEARVKATQPRDPALIAAWQEVQVLLNEEIARLPETLRAPFLLCCLENRSCAETACQLGVKEATVGVRLSRARKLLKEQLNLRGVSLTAVLAAIAIEADGVSAGVPMSVAISTARAASLMATSKAAAVEVISTKVVSLTEGMLKAMLMTNLKKTAALVLAVVIAVMGTGVLTYRTLAAGAPDRASVNPASRTSSSDEPKGVSGTPKESSAPTAHEKVSAFVGRVVAADGKAVAGADVALLGEPKSNPPDNNVGLGGKVLAHGRADADGKYRLSVARAALADYRAVYAIAGKAGHGLAWAPAELKTPSQETVVRLAPEKVVRGRLIDVQGQPAVGVRVSVLTLSGSAGKDSAVIANVSSPDGFPAWPGPATTGKDGKFTIAGLNPDLDGNLGIDGEEFNPAHAAIKAGKEIRNQEVNQTLTPARILEGVVTAKDTGKPVPKASVLCLEGGRPAYASTDEKGRYRLRVPVGEGQGLPTGVSAKPPEGQPYLPGEAPLEWPQGAVKHRIDLALARGVFVRGTVTDAATGKPIAGAKAIAVVTGGMFWSPDTPRPTTRDDGAFVLVVPPSRRGHVLVKGPNNDYIAGEITSGELRGGKRNGHRNYPDAVIPFETKPQGMADTLDVTAKLRRGVTIRGKLLGPGDKPVAHAVMVCWNHVENGGLWKGYIDVSVPVRDGTFELRGCDPEETYPVYFLDARNKLGATARLSAKEAAGKEVTVRLEPCGSAVLRFVDKEGKPLKGFRATAFMVFRPGDKGTDADSDFLDNVDTVNRGRARTADADGRYTLPVLIPGGTYFFTQNPKDLLTVKSGETLKKDVVIEPQQ